MLRRLPIVLAQKKQVIHMKIYLMKFNKLFSLYIYRKIILKVYKNAIASLQNEYKFYWFRN